MFADNTLTPKEATRLCALGSLALGPMTYSALAMSIRHFIGRVIGPTPEIMGHSIELLKYEGLVEAIEGSGDEALLGITDAGRENMRELLTANVRATSTALDKLIVALKLRFLHLLEPDDQCVQADLLVDACERELSRLDDLRRHHAGDAGYLVSWLDHDIGLLETRLAWLTDFRARLYAQG
jgi:DNA-binding PadR family transcriptional regulator